LATFQHLFWKGTVFLLQVTDFQLLPHQSGVAFSVKHTLAFTKARATNWTIFHQQQAELFINRRHKASLTVGRRTKHIILICQDNL